MSLPRPEHPRPQFQRDAWLSLNGAWRFAFDPGLSGEEQDWHLRPEEALDRQIEVPFCPESRLSGISHTDFISAVWYSRTFELPDSWRSRRVRLHFGAVDYEARVWVNGTVVGRHRGGSSSFWLDITAALRPGENTVVVHARDDTRSGVQAVGKQSPRLRSYGCHYTRTTGIWQSVWLEAVPEQSLDSVRIVPDFDDGSFHITPVISGACDGLRFRATLLDNGREADAFDTPAGSGLPVRLKPEQPHAWTLDDPHLYQLRLELLRGDEPLDTVHSYAGLRKFHIEKDRFFLNNEPIFLRLVLDQGFYPDGIWTAPSDEALKQDITLSKAAGFNGARLHQKVFEERFHFWADRLGYLTWGEYCDWGMDFRLPETHTNMQREWREILLRDRNHPSIIAWTPFNETAGRARQGQEIHRQAVQDVVDLTRALDPTRPVHDCSGYVHVDTDIYTTHDYQQDVAKFAACYDAIDPSDRSTFRVNFPDLDAGYRGQPYVVDEYGGTWWASESERDGTDREVSWGYGNRPDEIEEVYRRIEGLTEVLTRNPHVAGFCYTQLTDVEQEQNGVYSYDRKPKFDARRLKQAFGRSAACEGGE